MAKRIYGLGKIQAQQVVIKEIQKGASVAEAMGLVGRTTKTYENWRAESDGKFAAAIDKARGRKARADDKNVDPALYELDFASWRKKYLGSETYPHQMMWIDVLEDRTPDIFDPAITYKAGHSNRVVINTPPFHAKSTTITRDYVVYKLCMNPAFRVLIISKTLDFATKLLFGIKQLLTDPGYAQLQADYAPRGGWKPERGEGRWGASQIYLAGRSTDAVDKGARDPSVQAVGVGGQIYGSRTDLTILDDAVDDTNAHQYEKQFDWLTRTVLSRGRSAKVLVVGTRIATADLYSHLLNDDVYPAGVSPWTYLAQPAVLQYAEKPEDWKTLWPRSSQPLDEASDDEADEDGLYPAWDGPSLYKVRAENRPAMWALVYQQQQTSDDMVFPAACVWGCVQKRRKPGPLHAGAVGHPKFGSEGMTIIGSVDPAGTGTAFILVYAYERQTKKRYVLNAWSSSDTLPKWYQERIQEITPQYGVSEWVIEKQGYSNWIYHDETIMNFCRQRGVKISAHYTGAGNKIDPDFGVASMAPLFGSITKNANGVEMYGRDGIIEIPDPDYSPGIKALVEQLITWVPGISGAKLRQDGPMTLWFAETIARRYAMNGDGPAPSHLKRNRYLSRRAQERQYTMSAG
jgi:hypothetical protein